MAGDAETLPAIARRAGRCTGLALTAAIFALGAQAQTAANSEVSGVASAKTREQTQATTAPDKTRRPSGNPLWEIALSALRETRARPIFSASRRPRSPPVVAASLPPPPPPKPAGANEPERLRLSLLGTVTGTSDRIGIFMDEISKSVIRIRTGENHAGWILRSVERRAAKFAKDHQETTLVLLVAGAEQPAVDAASAGSTTGRAGVNRNAGDARKNHAVPAPPIIPVSAPTTRNAHKIRQDILSIGAGD